MKTITKARGVLIVIVLLCGFLVSFIAKADHTFYVKDLTALQTDINLIKTSPHLNGTVTLQLEADLNGPVIYNTITTRNKNITKIIVESVPGTTHTIQGAFVVGNFSGNITFQDLIFDGQLRSTTSAITYMNSNKLTSNSAINIENCTFDNCTKTGSNNVYGGAVSITANDDAPLQINISDSTFNHCIASLETDYKNASVGGGAVYIFAPQSETTIKKCTFNFCYMRGLISSSKDLTDVSEGGGAVDIVSSDFGKTTVENCRFLNCAFIFKQVLQQNDEGDPNLNLYGGVIFVGQRGKATISGCTFKHIIQDIVGSVAPTCFGGVICCAPYAKEELETKISDCHFENIHIKVNNQDGDTVTVTGGVISSPEKSSLSNCSFKDISVSVYGVGWIYGGAFYTEGMSSIKDNCSFQNIVAKFFGPTPSRCRIYGGAIFSENRKTTTIENSKFDKCTMDGPLGAKLKGSVFAYKGNEEPLLKTNTIINCTKPFTYLLVGHPIQKSLSRYKLATAL